jgi:hypothetical protein
VLSSSAASKGSPPLIVSGAPESASSMPPFGLYVDG